MSLRGRVSAMDEVAMSKMRFRLRLEGEEVPDTVRHVVEPGVVDSLYQQQVRLPLAVSYLHPPLYLDPPLSLYPLLSLYPPPLL